MGYNNLILFPTTEMQDIWSREIKELYHIDKQLNSRHKVQYNQETLTSIRLRVQSDMRYRILDPKLVCQL